MPSVERIAPPTSRRRGDGSRVSGTSTYTSGRSRSPSGTLTQKMLDQPKCWTRMPPAIGPITIPMLENPDQ